MLTSSLAQATIIGTADVSISQADDSILVYGYDGSSNQKISTNASGVVKTLRNSSTSTLTSVAGSATSVTVLAANTARLSATFYNDSAANLYLAFASTATTTAFTTKLSAGAYYEMPVTNYTGLITGIWDSATGSVRVTELT